MTKIEWANAKRKLSDLIPWPRNPRRIGDEQRKRLNTSLLEFAQVETIAIGPGNEVYNGHQRLTAWAEEYGDIEVDVRVASRPLTEKEREKLTVYLHKGAAGEWDWEKLADFDVADLTEWGFDADDLAECGFDAVEPVEVEDVEPQIDKAEELREKWGVETGQLWTCGNHRLLCGDSTKAEDVARVMGGEKARLIFTSPPYADQRTYEIGKFDWLMLANGMFNVLPIGEECDIVINLGLSYKDGKVNQYWQTWLEHCAANGIPLYGWYVWDKGAGFPGEFNGRLAPSHEWLFHFSIGRVSARKWVKKSENSFERNKYAHKSAQRNVNGEWRPPYSEHLKHQKTKIPDSIVRINRETEGYGNHPGIFPIDLPIFVMMTWSDNESIVYEPFSGSGTTIIAAEKLNRRCYAIEISPAYCAVALQRWADATGKTPILLNGQVTD